MWECTPQSLDRGRVQHYVPRRHGSPVRYCDVLRSWRDDEAFRSFFISLLSTAPFSGYRWETPPLTLSTAERDFEFVLLDAPGLDRTPEPQAFAQQFRSAREDQRVVTFPNLGNDAVLVVPCPAGPESAYVHLASFIRHGPEAQVHELWRVVGATMEARLSAKPDWLSTAGMGVSWLHVRLDSRPKYYGFRRYREEGRAPGTIRDIRINCSDSEPVLQSLCNQQPVERVTMERWEVGKIRHRSLIDRQARDPVSIPLPRQKIGRRSREWELTEMVLDD